MENKRRIYWFGLLAVMAAAAYANTLYNGFVAGDDEFLVRNPAIGQLSTVLNAFVTDYWKTLGGQSFVYYRPLVILSHFIDYQLYGLAPAGHHLTNLALHVLATLLVFRIFCTLIPGHTAAAFAGGALFALHPVHTHTVSYVLGRTDLLAAVFYLAGFALLAERDHRRGRMAAACLCYFLALLCKEMAVTLPLLVLAYRLSLRGPRPDGRPAVPWAALALMAVTFGAYMALRVWAVGQPPPAGGFAAHLDGWQRFALVPTTAGFYLWKLLLPVRLCYYSSPVIAETAAGMASSPYFLLGAGACAAGVLLLKAAPRASFAVMWILIALLPVLNIIQLPVFAKENYLYIPSAGFCLLPALLIAACRGRAARVLGCLAGAAAVLYGGATLKRNLDYRDPITFLKSTLAVLHAEPARPGNDLLMIDRANNFYASYKNLGRLYMKQKDWPRAAGAFEGALKYSFSLDPRYYAHVKITLASAYERSGNLDRAGEILKEVLPTAGRPHLVNNRLGVIAARQNDLDRAEAYFQAALGIRDTYAPAYFNLSRLYLQKNMPARAQEALTAAVRLDPAYQKHFSKGAP